MSRRPYVRARARPVTAEKAYVNNPAPIGAARPTIQAQQIGVPDIERPAPPLLPRMTNQ